MNLGGIGAIPDRELILALLSLSGTNFYTEKSKIDGFMYADLSDRMLHIHIHVCDEMEMIFEYIHLDQFIEERVIYR